MQVNIRNNMSLNVFVIMPFSDSISESVYKHSTKQVCQELGLNVQRADEIFSTNPILDDILSAIQEASIIIADISGKNPNVLYELGISHILKQNQTIMITHEEFAQLPFDISHFRIIRYKDTIKGKVTFDDQLKKTIKYILRDFRSLYKQEFDLIIDNLIRTKCEHELFAMLALNKSTKPILADDEFSAHGINKQIDIGTGGGDWGTAAAAFSFFVSFGYANINGGYIEITEKGRAFANVLEEKGYTPYFQLIILNVSLCNHPVFFSCTSTVITVMCKSK